MDFSLFPAFYDKPLSIKLAQQEEDEYIEIFLRQHWIVNVGWILSAIVLILVPLILSFTSQFFPQLFTIPWDILVASTVIWYLFILAFVIEKIVHWYFNIYVVTNKHILDVDFLNLLYRSITEARLDDVQSARSKISGIFGSLFNFGDVIIETAAKGQQIQFIAVPKPDIVADRIQDLQALQEGPTDNVS